MNVITLRTWIAFKSIIQHFLVNYRSADYENLVDEIMDCMKRLGSRMSIKMYFLRSHLIFPMIIFHAVVVSLAKNNCP